MASNTFAASVFALATGAQISAVCDGLRCRAVAGRIAGAAATGSFDDTIETIGWATLSISSTLQDARGAGFAAGFVEGHLTADRILQMYSNYKASNDLEPEPPAAISAFVEANDKWARRSAEDFAAEDPFWGSVLFMYSQLEGLAAGVRSQGYANFSYRDALMLNLQGDIIDLKPAVNRSTRAYIASMTEPELASFELNHSHCSALVKLLADGSDLYAGHNMWWGYYIMLRVFKHYSFPAVLGGRMADIAMPSYPGIIASNDDFYQMSSGLVVIETTNNVYDHSLYDLVQPESLMYFFRVMTANYLGRNGSDWMSYASRYNSGTYNNMWMVVDYNVFQPGKPLFTGLLTVGEQLPGHFIWDDKTVVLSFGYWPSYNKAFFHETEMMSGQGALVKQRGPEYSYQLNSRAQVFRRDQATVIDEAGMRRLLRYNDYKRDPIAKGEPCRLLACRMDLSETRADAFGAVDAKYTSYQRVKRMEMTVVSGPAHDDGLPVFDWSEQPDYIRAKPHVGQPERFDFDWVTMGPYAQASEEQVLVTFL